MLALAAAGPPHQHLIRIGSHPDMLSSNEPAAEVRA